MTDVITLIKQTSVKDKYGISTVTETKRTVFCEVQSITQSEFYAAANTEFNPEYRFVVFFGDYEGETVAVYGGARYSIYRTFRTGDDLELYAERKAGTWTQES